LHELLVLAVHGIATAAAAQARSPRPAHRAVIAPVSTPLSVGAIASHMAGVAANAADDTSSEVLLLGTVIFAMSDLAAVLACLVLVIAKSSVQGGELAQLVPLQLILPFGNRRGRLDDIVDQLLCLVDLVLGVGHDKAVEVLFLVAGMRGIRATFAFLHRALSANSNLGAGFCFHLLECVATRSDE